MYYTHTTSNVKENHTQTDTNTLPTISHPRHLPNLCTNLLSSSALGKVTMLKYVKLGNPKVMQENTIQQQNRPRKMLPVQNCCSESISYEPFSGKRYVN